MTMSGYSGFIDALSICLKEAEFSDGAGHRQSVASGIEAWEERSLALKATRRTVFFIGNGASASMASHFAADIGKNAGIRTRTFTDAPALTAFGNDLSFDRVFSLPLARHADPGDMLVAISSSGNSPNVVEAVRVARETGLVVATLSGMGPDNRIRRAGDLNFWVPAATYGLVETAHAAILHYWTDRLVAEEAGSSGNG